MADDFFDKVLTTPAPTTLNARIDAVLANFATAGVGQLDTLVNFYNQAMQLFWANPERITPVDLVTRAGTGAVSMLSKFAELKAFVISQKADYADKFAPIPPEYAWDGGMVYNADGTVTLNRKMD